MLDPIVEETRQARQTYFQECGGTLLGLYEDLKRKEQASTRIYCALSSKPVAPRQPTQKPSPQLRAPQKVSFYLEGGPRDLATNPQHLEGFGET